MVAVILGLVLLSLCSFVHSQPLDWTGFNLVWSDNFDEWDGTKWQHEITASGGGNGEFQVYTPSNENSYVANGKLYIKPTLLANSRNPQTGQAYGDNFMNSGILDLNTMYGGCTDAGNNGCYRTGAAGNMPPVMSARVRSYQRFAFRYGRVAISAKMPVGDWLWPAIWMLPEDWVYGGWPRSGEIDIVESIGNRNLQCGGQFTGIQKMSSTLHWGQNWDDNRYYLTGLPKYDINNNFGDNFHNYIFDWSPNGLRFFIDDQQQALLDVPYPLVNVNPNWVNFWEWGKPWKVNDSPWPGGVNIAPFDQFFHFILNVAVGGTNGFIPDGCANQGGAGGQQKPWANGQDQNSAMQAFYNSRGAWLNTWNQEGDNSAMQIDYIDVYQQQ